MQAIYLFGSHGTTDEWPDSDVDIAVLLPPQEARQQPSLMLTNCHLALVDALGKEVDIHIVTGVIVSGLEDLLAFAEVIRAYFGGKL